MRVALILIGLLLLRVSGVMDVALRNRILRGVTIAQVWLAYVAWLQQVSAATRKRRSPVVWVINFLRKRDQNSQCFNVMRDLQDNSVGHPRTFLTSYGVDVAMFKYLCERIGPLIVRQNTKFRRAISVEERLTVTLHYLVSGGRFKVPRLGYVMSIPSISRIVSETTAAIIEVFEDEVMNTPSTEAEWHAIAQRYNERWNFPHVLGSIDGKHIRVKKPANSGSQYFNYKKYFSIILFAMVDADLRFRYIEVGEPGKAGDSSIFLSSPLFRGFQENINQVPKAECLEGDTVEMPYFLIADSAFRMRTWLLKPYPINKSSTDRKKQIFSYRLSRARMTVECAFGVLASR